MSEVKRKLFEAANPVPFGVFWSEPDSRYMTSMVHLNCIEFNGKWLGWNSAQSELSALREELAEIKESLAYRGSLLNRTQQRAEAAEQRNAELIESSSTVIGACESAIKHVIHNLKASGKRVDIGLAGSSCDEALRRINQFRKAHAKPTESGASE